MTVRNDLDAVVVVDVGSHCSAAGSLVADRLVVDRLVVDSLVVDSLGLGSRGLEGLDPCGLCSDSLYRHHHLAVADDCQTQQPHTDALVAVVE